MRKQDEAVVDQIGHFRDEPLIAFFQGGDDDFDRLFAYFLGDFAGFLRQEDRAVYDSGVGLALRAAMVAERDFISSDMWQSNSCFLRDFGPGTTLRSTRKWESQSA